MADVEATQGDQAAAPKARPPQDEDVFDLDALAQPPQSRYRVRVHGVEYAIRQMAQLTGDEELDLRALERVLKEAKTDEDVRRAMYDRASHLVRVLVPSMPDQVRRGLQYIEMMALANHAWAYARRPPLPLADTSAVISADSALTSPEPNSKVALAGHTVSTPGV